MGLCQSLLITYLGGYVCVTSASLAGVLLGVLFLSWRMRSFKWVPVKKEVSKLITYSAK